MKVAVRCPNFPECRCGDDCTDDRTQEPLVVARILFGLMAAVAAIGAGLIYWSFQP